MLRKAASTQDVGSRIFVFLSFSFFNHPFPNSYTMKIFFHFFFLLWPGNLMLLFTYFRLLQRLAGGVIQLPNACWKCYDGGGSIVLPVKHFWFSMPQLHWGTQLPFYHISFLNPREPFLTLRERSGAMTKAIAAWLWTT